MKTGWVGLTGWTGFVWPDRQAGLDPTQPGKCVKRDPCENSARGVLYGVYYWGYVISCNDMYGSGRRFGSEVPGIDEQGHFRPIHRCPKKNDSGTPFKTLQSVLINHVASFSSLAPPHSSPAPTSRKVAVIGAGAAGLVAARELRREGHQVVVFERNDKVGGTWVYEPKTESDPLGRDPSRTIVHTSLYDSLRTNLPRESMGFRDYPFVVVKRDPRRFPGHREVCCYLSDFAHDFGIVGLIRFETEVLRVGLSEENNKWRWLRGGLPKEGMVKRLRSLMLWWFVMGTTRSHTLQIFQVLVTSLLLLLNSYLNLGI
ncbi:hypothetical protein Sjap_020426 [Stephania japonica]|uniref:Flavin-containing monooxygenase n=1 Tax=Stephania japonica TaxID=461633 RepID=A0AAP0F670_9MAGN